MTDHLNDTIWLTRAAHDRLQEELVQLTRNPAPSPEADARIRELHALLRRAEVGDKPDDGLVEPGMTVTVRFDGDKKSTKFLLGQRAIADPEVEIDIYPPTSPLGAAITGKHPGDTFSYEAPSGARVGGKIVAASPFVEE